MTGVELLAAAVRTGNAPDRPAREAPAPARRITGDLAWTAAGDVAARGVSLGFSVFCARVLAVADFGLFALAQSAVQYLWLLADGVANSGYGTREVARAGRSAGSTAGEIFAARLAAGLAITVLYLGALTLLPLDPAWRTVLSAGAIFFLGYASFPDWIARGLGDFRALALAQFGMAAGLLAACAFLLPRYPHPVVATAIWGGSFFVGAAFLIPVVVRDGGFRFRAAFAGAELRRHLGRSAVFSIGALGAVGITQLPTILLGALAPPGELALFAVAFRVVMACVGVGSIAWWPFYAALSASAPGSASFTWTFRAFLVLMLGVSLPLAVGVWLFASDLVPALFGAQYVAAVPLLQWLVWTLPLYGLVNVLEFTALSTGDEWLRVRVNWIAVGVLVVALLAFVPAMGARGAAFALGLALLAAAVGYLVAMRRRLPAGVWTGAGVRSLFVATAGVVAIRLFVPGTAELRTWGAASAGMVVYALLAARLGAGRARTRPGWGPSPGGRAAETRPPC